MTHEHRANKALGQHFLRDRNAINKIAHSLPIGAHAIEIGPGPGAITNALLERVDRLTVIEKDDRFAEVWRQEGEHNPKLRVVHGDVLKVLQETVTDFKPDWIAGNLPYNISGPLTALLSSLHVSGGMVLMYQREVGQRIMADPGSRTYGGLSVLVRHHYNVKRLLTLPPGAFAPPPKVHSVVLQLLPHGNPPECEWSHLQRCVRIGFAHRRKTLRNNFRNFLSVDAITALDIDPGARAEQLAYPAWVRLSNEMFLKETTS